MYMTLICSITLYGSETWAPRKIEEIKLNIFKTEIIRPIHAHVPKTMLVTGSHKKKD